MEDTIDVTSIYNYSESEWIQRIETGTIKAEDMCCGVTLLYGAVMRGHEQLVRSLVAHKADVNRAGNGWGLPLFCAILMESPSMCRLLIDAKANPAQCHNGLTIFNALHHTMFPADSYDLVRLYSLRHLLSEGDEAAASFEKEAHSWRADLFATLFPLALPIADLARIVVDYVLVCRCVRGHLPSECRTGCCFSLDSE